MRTENDRKPSRFIVIRRIFEDITGIKPSRFSEGLQQKSRYTLNHLPLFGANPQTELFGQEWRAKLDALKTANTTHPPELS
jgi:hypothetical protein